MKRQETSRSSCKDVLCAPRIGIKSFHLIYFDNLWENFESHIPELPNVLSSCFLRWLFVFKVSTAEEKACGSGPCEESCSWIQISHFISCLLNLTDNKVPFCFNFLLTWESKSDTLNNLSKGKIGAIWKNLSQKWACALHLHWKKSILF